MRDEAVTGPRLPTFLIIGAQKAATTSLWSAIRRHEQVYCPPNKEPRFFSPGAPMDRGKEWYASLFAAAGDAVAIGEASTTYTWYPLHGHVPERILAMLPDARFVYVLRDPVERMRSAYLHAVSLGVETFHIGRALLWQSQYLYPSMYAMQIEQYLQYVDRSRLLLVSTRDFRKNRDETLRRVFTFIGVHPELPLAPGSEQDVNVGSDRRAPRAGSLWATRMMREGPLRRVVPPRWQFQARQHPLLTKPIPEHDTKVHPETRARLLDVLRPDIARLREQAAGEISAAELDEWET
ncbi:MAG: sulfotransferase family protein [Actinomycetes bacterium]